MIVGENNVIEWIKDSNCPYWTVKNKSSDSNGIIARSGEKPNLHIEESTEMLSKLFARLKPGIYYMTITDKERDEERGRKVGALTLSSFIDIKGDQNAAIGAPTQHQPQPQGMTAEMIQKQIEAAIDKVHAQYKEEQYKREIAELKKEVKELKPSTLEARIAGLLPTLKPFVPGIMAKMGISPVTTPIAVSGFANQGQNEVEVQTDQETRIATALEGLHAVLEANGISLVDLLEKLNYKAQTNPSEFIELIEIANAALAE